MRKFIVACLALAFSTHAFADPGRAPQVTSLPATTPGAMIEDTAETVFHWTADDWNMIRYPDDLTQAAWTKGDVTTTTEIVTETATTASHNVRTGYSPVVTGQVGTFSARMKPGLRTMVLVSFAASTTFCYVDLALNSISICTGASGYVILEADGYRRVVVTTTATGTGYVGVFATKGVGVTSYLGDASAPAFYLKNVQYARGTTSAYKSPPTANLLASPSAFDNAAWSKGSAGGPIAPAVIATNLLAPDSTMTADTVRIYGTTGTGQVSQVYQSFTAAAVTYTATVWVKAAAPTTFYLSFYRAVGSAFMQPCAATTAWTQCTLTATLTATTWYLTLGHDSRHANQPTVPTVQAESVVTLWRAALTRNDMQGDTPMMTGTVPLVTTSPLYAKGSGAGRRFVGPYTDTNYFQLGAGPDVLDFAGDFTLCTAFRVNSVAAQMAVVADGEIATAKTGYYIFVNVGGAARTTFASGDGTGVSPTTANLVGANELAIYCTGRSGTTGYVKLNGGTTVSATVSRIAGTNTPLYIGRHQLATNQFNGSIYEVWATSTPFGEAAVAQIQAAALANGGKGAFFPDDANTVLHLVGDAYDGLTWKAPQAALTTVGAVSYSDAWVMPAAGNLQRQGYGPFSTANYLTLGGGADVLDFSGDFSMCAVFSQPSSFIVNNILIGARNSASNAGWVLYVPTVPAGALQINNYGSSLSSTTTPYAMGAGLNVVCAGRVGANLAIKMNLGAYTTAGITGTVVPSTETTLIGVLNGVSPSSPFLGNIYEVWASTEAPSDALFTKIQQRIFQQQTAQGAPLTVTRTTSSMVEVPNGSSQTHYTVPAGVVSQAADGIEAWRQSTNIMLQNAALDSAPWSLTNASVVANGVVAPDGQPTADTLSDGVAVGVQHYIAQPVTPTVGTTYAMSVYGKTGTGTAGRQLRFGLASPAGYTNDCDLTAGTTAAGSNGANTTNSTITAYPNGWYRCSFTLVAPTTPTSIFLALGYGNTYTGANNTMSLWGAQLEVAPYVTPLIATAGTSVQRNADVLSIPNTIPANVPNFCVRFEARPGVGHTWNDGQPHAFLSSGAAATPNSFSIMQDPGGSLTFEVYDATSTSRAVTTTGFFDGQAHEVAACTGNGTPYLYVDGARAGGAVTGIGTAIMAAPQSTLHVGSHNGMMHFLDGAIRDVSICDRPTGACIPPAVPSTTRAYYAFDRTGTFATDANTVTYVTWDGAKLVDPYAVTTQWSMVGTVPQNVNSPFYPSGFVQSSRKGAGPFSAANHYALGTGVDALDFLGDFTCHLAFGLTAAVQGALLTNGAFNVNGYYANVEVNGTINFVTSDGNASNTVTALAAGTANLGPNVLSFGRSGTTQYAKANLGATANSAGSKFSVAAGTPARIGLRTGSTMPLTSGVVYALTCTTTPWNETTVTQQQQWFFGLTGSNGETVTVTRTTTAMNTTPDGVLWTWPAGVARVGCDVGGSPADCGMLTEPTRTNALLYSDVIDIAAGTWAAVAVTAAAPTVTQNTTDVLDPRGTNAAEKIVFPAVAADQVSLITQSFTATAVPWSTGIWFRTAAGTATISTWLWNSTTYLVTPCTITTTWTRCTNLNRTLTAASWAYRFGFDARPAAANTSTNAAPLTVYAWNGQAEVGPFVSTDITTAGTPVTRNVDVVAIANPFAASNPAVWCAAGTYTPAGGRGWSSAGAANEFMWLAGAAAGQANTAYAWLFSGAINGSVHDAGNNNRDRYGAAPTWAAGSTHRIAHGWAADLFLYTDDVLVPAATGAGTSTAGVSTWNPTLYIGSGSSAGTGPFAAFTRNFRLCNSQCNTCR
jgi:hypothetical protein